MRHLLEEEIEDVENVPLVLPLDRATVAWLLRISLGNDDYAACLIASMIRAIREDDEISHRNLH